MSISRRIEQLFGNAVHQKPKQHLDINGSAESLQALTEFFSENTIPCYVVFGTLLSTIREKALFSHDHDIDVAIHARDLPRFSQLLDQLLERGFVVSELGWSVIKLRSLPSDCHLDIWIIEPVKNPLLTLFGKHWRLDHAVFPRHYFDRQMLQTDSCYAFQVVVPNDPIALLEEWYGKEWQVPKRNAFAEYRAVLSRIIAFPFLKSVMPFRFSNNPVCCYARPWLRWMIKIVAPRSRWASVPEYVIK